MPQAELKGRDQPQLHKGQPYKGQPYKGQPYKGQPLKVGQWHKEEE